MSEETALIDAMGQPMSTETRVEGEPQGPTFDDLRALLARMDAADKDFVTKNSNRQLLRECAQWMVGLSGEIVRLRQLNASLTAPQISDTP